MKTLENRDTTELIEESLIKATSYKEYRDLVEKLVSEGKSTGKNQTEALSNYSFLNHKRMKRWDKTIKMDGINLPKVSKKTTWLVLTESWCADAAHSMPLMNKIAELDPNITFKVILRDENLDLMNRFLYNGTLSIPKLIMIDEETTTVVGDWGPRPSEATKMVANFKSEHGKLTAEFKQEQQVWYNKNKGQNTLRDLKAYLL